MGQAADRDVPGGVVRRLLPGARYHGAIHMLFEPTGRRMRGKWLRSGKDLDINSGPWELIFRAASTSRSTLGTYNRTPAADDPEGQTR